MQTGIVQQQLLPLARVVGNRPSKKDRRSAWLRHDGSIDEAPTALLDDCTCLLGLFQGCHQSLEREGGDRHGRRLADGL